MKAAGRTQILGTLFPFTPTIMIKLILKQLKAPEDNFEVTKKPCYGFCPRISLVQIGDTLNRNHCILVSGGKVCCAKGALYRTICLCKLAF